MAEIVSLNTFVLFNISNAPTDVALAFSLGQPYLGLVINKLLNPKFFSPVKIHQRVFINYSESGIGEINANLR